MLPTNKPFYLFFLFLSFFLSVGFSIPLIQNGDFEQTVNSTYSPYWTLLPDCHSIDAIYINASNSSYNPSGNWSVQLKSFGYNAGGTSCGDSIYQSGVYQTFSPNFLVSTKLFVAFKMNITVQNGGTSCITLSNDSNGYQFLHYCGTIGYTNTVISTNVSPSSLYKINASVDIGDSFYTILSYIDDLNIYTANLTDPTVSNIGTSFTFSVKTDPDTSDGFLMYANLSCGLSSPQLQLANQLLSYDTGSHTWKATGISVPNCAGSYNATFFGTRFGYDTIQTSALRTSADIGYTLTVDSTIWSPNIQRKFNLTFYDTQTTADITQYISKYGSGLLNTTLNEILDPNNYSHAVNFFYNSVTNKFEANYTTQNIICTALDCVWAKDYLMNLTGITLTGYTTLNIRVTYAPSSFNVLGTYYFDKDKTGSLTSPDIKLGGYDVYLVKRITALPTKNDATLYGSSVTTTASNGTFNFTGITEGLYTLWLKMAGSGTTPYNEMDLVYNNTNVQHGYILLNLTSALTNTQEVNLEEGRTIRRDASGNIIITAATFGTLVNFTVTNASGNNVNGLLITSSTGYDSSYIQVKTCTTNAAGQCYILVSTPIDIYRIMDYRFHTSGAGYISLDVKPQIPQFNYGSNKYLGAYYPYSIVAGSTARYIVTDLNGTPHALSYTPTTARAGDYLNYVNFKIKDLYGTTSSSSYLKYPGQGTITCLSDECRIDEMTLWDSPYALDNGMTDSCEICNTIVCGAIPNYGCNFECSHIIDCKTYLKLGNETPVQFDSSGHLTNINYKLTFGQSIPYKTYSTGFLIGEIISQGVFIKKIQTTTNEYVKYPYPANGALNCFMGAASLTLPDGCSSPATNTSLLLYSNCGSDIWGLSVGRGPTQSGFIANNNLQISCNQSSTISIRVYGYEDVDETFSYTFGAGYWTENRYKEAHLDTTAHTLNVKFNITSLLLGNPLSPNYANISIDQLNTSATYDMTVSGSQVSFLFYNVTDPAGTKYDYTLGINVPAYTFNDSANSSRGVIYSSIDHYSDVACGLEPSTQSPGQNQLAFCKFKTVNGSTITQTNGLSVKIDSSIGSAPLIVVMPFEKFDGDYNYYTASVILNNYSLSPSGLGIYYPISSPSNGKVKVTIVDPNSYYPTYEVMVPYMLDANVVNTEPIINSIKLYSGTGNFSVGDNVYCQLNFTDSQGKINNATFSFWGGNLSETAAISYPATTLMSSFAEVGIFNLDTDGTFGLTDSSKFCCRGTIYYDWAGVRKSKSSSTCNEVNPKPNPNPSGDLSFYIDLGHITDWVIANPLSFILLLIIIVVGVPLILYLL